MNDEKDKEIVGGIKFNSNGLFCLACRCKRNVFVKDKKKITDETGKTIVEESIETSTIAFGRGASPEIQPRTLTVEERIDELEKKIEEIKNKKIEDIDTGFKRGITVDERLIKLEKEVYEVKQMYQFQFMD